MLFFRPKGQVRFFSYFWIDDTICIMFWEDAAVGIQSIRCDPKNPDRVRHPAVPGRYCSINNRWLAPSFFSDSMVSK